VSTDWKKLREAALAEAAIEEREHPLDYAERCRSSEPWSHAELSRMEGLDGESRWR
jgi:hypothetical protein